eukprot:gene9960-2137_t
MSQPTSSKQRHKDNQQETIHSQSILSQFPPSSSSFSSSPQPSHLPLSSSSGTEAAPGPNSSKTNLNTITSYENHNMPTLAPLPSLSSLAIGPLSSILPLSAPVSVEGNKPHASPKYKPATTSMTVSAAPYVPEDISETTTSVKPKAQVRNHRSHRHETTKSYDKTKEKSRQENDQAPSTSTNTATQGKSQRRRERRRGRGKVTDQDNHYSCVHPKKVNSLGRENNELERTQSINASVDAGMLCGVCFEPMSIKMVGSCNHPLCFLCGIRLRCLWRTNACAICRKDLNKVILTDNPDHSFQTAEKEKLIYNKRIKGFVTSNQVENDCVKLFQLQCRTCNSVFREPYELRQHTKEQHNRSYCPLCVGNAHKFYFELDTYFPHELDLHKKKGTAGSGKKKMAVDDGFKGHPQCEFCRQHFYDNDALYLHLRQQHEHCQLCANLGDHHVYFPNRAALVAQLAITTVNVLPAFIFNLPSDANRQHYDEDHHRCPYCNESDMVAFEDIISLRKHILNAHPDKAGAVGVRRKLINVNELFSVPSYSEQQQSERRGYHNRYRQPKERQETSQKESIQRHNASRICSDDLDDVRMIELPNQTSGHSSLQTTQAFPASVLHTDASSSVLSAEAPSFLPPSSSSSTLSWASSSHKKASEQSGGSFQIEEFPSLLEEQNKQARHDKGTSAEKKISKKGKNQSQQQKQQQQKNKPRQPQKQQRPSPQLNFATVTEQGKDVRVIFGEGPQPVIPTAPSWPARAANSTGSNVSTFSTDNTVGSSYGNSGQNVRLVEPTSYITPSNAKECNAKLGKTLKQVLSGQAYSQFMSQSVAFDRKHISPFEFAMKCSELFGQYFNKIFSDLVILYPDIDVQQEMVVAWKRINSPSPKIQIGKSATRAKQVPTNPNWIVCRFCNQVLGPKDVGFHESQHDQALESEFPVLARIPKSQTRKSHSRAETVWKKKNI